MGQLPRHLARCHGIPARAKHLRHVLPNLQKNAAQHRAAQHRAARHYHRIRIQHSTLYSQTHLPARARLRRKAHRQHVDLLDATRRRATTRRSVMPLPMENKLCTTTALLQHHRRRARVPLPVRRRPAMARIPHRHALLPRIRTLLHRIRRLVVLRKVLQCKHAHNT